MLRLSLAFVAGMLVAYCIASEYWPECRVSAAEQSIPVSDRYDIGFADGWMGYAIDSAAIHNYHSRLDQFEKDIADGKTHTVGDADDEWGKIRRAALKNEQDWLAMSKEDRIKQTRHMAYWKYGKGLPRSLLANSDTSVSDFEEPFYGFQQEKNQ